MEIGDRISIRTGTIVKITEYPELDIKYYVVKMYEPWRNGFDYIYVESSMLEQIAILKYRDNKVISATHLREYEDE